MLLVISFKSACSVTAKKWVMSLRLVTTEKLNFFVFLVLCITQSIFSYLYVPFLLKVYFLLKNWHFLGFNLKYSLKSTAKK